MSKNASEAKFIQSQLEKSREEVNILTEREEKFKLSTKTMEEKILFLETRLEEASFKLVESERQIAQEKATMLRMKDEWSEKTKMMQIAHEKNVIHQFVSCLCIMIYFYLIKAMEVYVVILYVIFYQFI